MHTPSHWFQKALIINVVPPFKPQTFKRRSLVFKCFHVVVLWGGFRELLVPCVSFHQQGFSDRMQELFELWLRILEFCIWLSILLLHEHNGIVHVRVSLIIFIIDIVKVVGGRKLHQHGVLTSLRLFFWVSLLDLGFDHVLLRVLVRQLWRVHPIALNINLLFGLVVFLKLGFEDLLHLGRFSVTSVIQTMHLFPMLWNPCRILMRILVKDSVLLVRRRIWNTWLSDARSRAVLYKLTVLFDNLCRLTVDRRLLVVALEENSIAVEVQILRFVLVVRAHVVSVSFVASLIHKLDRRCRFIHVDGTTPNLHTFHHITSLLCFDIIIWELIRKNNWRASSLRPPEPLNRPTLLEHFPGASPGEHLLINGPRVFQMWFRTSSREHLLKIRVGF